MLPFHWSDPKAGGSAVYRYDILHDVHLESLETDEYEDFLPSRTMISCEVRDSHLILYLANEALYKGTYASVDLVKRTNKKDAGSRRKQA